MTLMRQNAVGFSWRTPSRWSAVNGVQNPQAAQTRLAATAAAPGGGQRCSGEGCGAGPGAAPANRAARGGPPSPQRSPRASRSGTPRLGGCWRGGPAALSQPQQDATAALLCAPRAPRAQAERPEETLPSPRCSLPRARASRLAQGSGWGPRSAGQSQPALAGQAVSPARPAGGCLCPGQLSPAVGAGQHVSHRATGSWRGRGHPPKPPSSGQSKARATAAARSGQGKIPPSPNRFLTKLNLTDLESFNKGAVILPKQRDKTNHA